MNNFNIFDITGKKILVTGGSRGLGYGMAEGFLKAGAEVVITGTSEKVFESVEKLKNNTGGVVHGVVLNLDNAANIAPAFDEVMELLDNRLDVLVNCAGMQHRCKAEEFPVEMWDKIINVNLSSLFKISQLAGRVMLEQGSGKIINIASLTSLIFKKIGGIDMNNFNIFDITGKKILVTGGSRGLGYGMAEGFLKAGAEVVITGTSEKVFESVEKLKNNTGGVVHGVVLNLDNAANIAPAFDEVMELLDNRLDVLVNCAGMQHRCKAEEFPVEMWDKIINVNLSSLFKISQLAGRVMLEQGSGKIINIASLTSFIGSESIPAYTATKGAVMQLTKAFSNEWSSRGVQVNAIAPGYMETDLTANMKSYNPKQYEEVTNRIPMHRWGKPEDLQGVAIFLASSASDYVSGAIIPVDGGFLGK